jgi:hypothetical protein
MAWAHAYVYVAALVFHTAVRLYEQTDGTTRRRDGRKDEQLPAQRGARGM